MLDIKALGRHALAAHAPLGMGSAQISVTGTQRVNLASYQFKGTPLADITDLRYSTYNASAGNTGSVNRSCYLQFNVDFNGMALTHCSADLYMFPRKMAPFSRIPGKSGILLMVEMRSGVTQV